MPPLPVQVTVTVTSLLALIADDAVNPLLPEVPLTPVIPEALHEVALEELQVNVELCPSLIVEGLKLALTTGSGRLTMTWVELV